MSRDATARKAVQSTITFTWPDAARQFTTHLEAGLKSPETIASYLAAIHQAEQFLTRLGLPDNVTVLTREHVELFVADLGKRVSSATVVNRFKGLRAFFHWLETEGEISDNPMANMEWPKLQEKPPSACTPEEVRAMIGTCGRDFAGRRDTALIAFMVDTGWRVTEVLAVTVDMVRERGSLSVPAKGKRTVTARLTPHVQQLIDRYLRVRTAPRPALWLSRSGTTMDRHAVWEVLAARSKAAGIAHVHPHKLRHTHAIWWLEDGGSVMDLKENMGHSSVRITERYTLAMAQERALKARERYGPGQRLAD